MTPIAAPPEGTVVTVGTFDGVHRGHRAVLEEIGRRARARNRAAVLVTFEPHPLAVVNPAAAPQRLNTARERMEALATCDIDRVLVLRFDQAMAAMEPEEFVRRVLVDSCRAREVVIGHDHGFGHGRQGDVETLRSLGGRYQFEVDVIGPVAGSLSKPISSTGIRRAIAGGDLAGAARQLGRWYTLTAPVEHGECRGRGLGFPTLNLAIPANKLLPPDGVWAVRVETPLGRFDGMMNQGHRPTFGDGRRLLEAHLFDADVDLYDRMVRVTWLEQIRSIHAFTDVAALKRQLQDDELRSRAIISGIDLNPDAPLTAPE